MISSPVTLDREESRSSAMTLSLEASPRSSTYRGPPDDADEEEEEEEEEADARSPRRRRSDPTGCAPLR
jgi:hypothetical protein